MASRIGPTERPFHPLEPDSSSFLHEQDIEGDLACFGGYGFTPAMKLRVVLVGSLLLACAAGFLWLSRSNMRTSTVDTAHVADVRGADASVELADPGTQAGRNLTTSAAVADSESEPAMGADMTIVCLDPRGAPVPGAVVSVAVPATSEYGSIEGWPGLCLTREEVEKRGTRFVADARGRIRAPRPEAYAILLGRSGELSGLMIVEALEASPISLGLHAPRRLRVHARDDRGNPIAGLGLQLVDAHNDTLLLWRGRTDSSGAIDLICEEGGQARLIAEAAVWPPAVRFLDLRTPPAEPIELVLPATGLLEVRIVGADKQPLPLRGRLRVGLPRTSGGWARVDDEPDLLWVPFAGGRCNVRCSPDDRGCSLMPVLDSGPPIEEVCVETPARLGDVVDVPFTIARDRVLPGIAQDAAGRTLAATVLNWRMIRSPAPTGSDAPWVAAGTSMTDGQGRFQCLLGSSLVTRERLRLRMDAWIERVPHWAEIDLDMKGETTPDCGIVHLMPLDRFVAGHVVDQDGHPIHGARIRAEVPSKRGSLDVGITSTPSSDADGGFVVFGSVEAATVQFGVIVDGEELPVDDDTRMLRRGDGDVRLHVHTLGTIEGRLLVDPDVEPFELWIGARNVENAEVRSQTTQWNDGTGKRFRVRNLTAGTWTLEFGRESEKDVDARVEGVEVVSGSPSRDARLWPLDLRGRLRTDGLEPTLRLIDAHGAPLAHGRAWFVLDGVLCGPQAWFDGTWQAPHSADSVLLWSPGCRVRRGVVASQSETWRLEPAVQARVALDLPDRYRRKDLRFRLEVSEPADDALPPMLMHQDLEIDLDPDGAFNVELPDAGRYECSLRLEWQTSTSEGAAKLERFELEVPPDTAVVTHPLAPVFKTWDEVCEGRGLIVNPR